MSIHKSQSKAFKTEKIANKPIKKSIPKDKPNQSLKKASSSSSSSSSSSTSHKLRKIFDDEIQQEFSSLFTEDRNDKRFMRKDIEMEVWKKKWENQLLQLQKIRTDGMKLKAKGHVPKSNCSARVIPYFINEFGNIMLILVKVRDYKDWTAMGGKCVEIKDNCPSVNDAKLLECLKREVIEESHFAIDDEDLLISDNEHCVSFDYIDVQHRWNNVRFSRYVGDPHLLEDRFYNQALLDHLATLKNSRDYLETIDLAILRLDTTFYNYMVNTLFERDSLNKRIDSSLLDGLYDNMDVETPLQLINQLSSILGRCKKR